MSQTCIVTMFGDRKVHRVSICSLDSDNDIHAHIAVSTLNFPIRFIDLALGQNCHHSSSKDKVKRLRDVWQCIPVLDLVPYHERSYEHLLRLYPFQKNNFDSWQTCKVPKKKLFLAVAFLKKNLWKSKLKHTAANVTALLPKLLFAGPIRNYQMQVTQLERTFEL